jgi:ATP-dependent Lhr-like helicase
VHHVKLKRVSPLAVPVLLEIGRESVRSEGGDDLLLEEAALVAEAIGDADPPRLRMRAPPSLKKLPPKQGRLFA